MNIILTSAQEAAFNAAGEAATEIGVPLHLQLGESRGVSAFGHVDQKDMHSTFISTGFHPTAAEAAAEFIRKYEEERSKPPKITRAPEAIAAVQSIIAEARGSADHMDLADIERRVGELPVE